MSCPKTRSSSSFLNTGTRLSIFFIELSLLSVHIPGGNDPNQVSSLCENHNKWTSIIRVAEGRPSFLRRRMLQITKNQQGGIEKYLLTLPVLNMMSDPALQKNKILLFF